MHKLLSVLVGVLYIFVISSIAFADQTLVITLDPPAQQDAQTNLELKHETLTPTSSASTGSSASQAGTGSTANGVAVGQIGVISAVKAGIKRLPSSRSCNLFTCPRNTYIAIMGEYGDWYGVLMSDSSTGWVEKGKVQLLNYQIPNRVAAATSPLSNPIVNTALRYLGLGISYKWGGYSLAGLDCSGFVKAVYASNGIALPRTAREQAQVGLGVTSGDQLRPGDRLYFACKGGQIDHAGIYLGNGYFIHCSSSHGGVAVDPITKPLFMRSLVIARRG